MKTRLKIVTVILTLTNVISLTFLVFAFLPFPPQSNERNLTTHPQQRWTHRKKKRRDVSTKHWSGSGQGTTSRRWRCSVR